MNSSQHTIYQLSPKYVTCTLLKDRCRDVVWSLQIDLDGAEPVTLMVYISKHRGVMKKLAAGALFFGFVLLMANRSEFHSIWTRAAVAAVAAMMLFYALLLSGRYPGAPPNKR